MLVKPYGDTMNDGAVQLSFTLPVPDSPKAREAARQLVLHLGFKSCQIVDASPIGSDFTMFIAYGRTDMAIDLDLVDAGEDACGEAMDFDEVNEFIERHIGRRIVVVGACTGSDAHTIGIDAIMNMKGCNHHYGLERYPMVEAHNLGAQVRNEDLIAAAVERNADAILISQIVTQKDVHIRNLTEFVTLLREKGLRDRFIIVVGGPGIDHKLALELGFDAGFGRGAYAEHVATFVAKRMAERAGDGGRKTP